MKHIIYVIPIESRIFVSVKSGFCFEKTVQTEYVFIQMVKLDSNYDKQLNCYELNYSRLISVVIQKLHEQPYTNFKTLYMSTNGLTTQVLVL